MKKTPTRALLITALTVTLLLLSVVGLVLFRPGTGYVTVTFETAGGTAIAPLRVVKGATLALPAAEKEGKTFRAWYYDEALTDKVPDSIRVTKDITLYARFGVTLTFDTQGGTPVSPVIYDEDAMFGSPAASYKTGFVFLGWFYDPECTRKVWENDIFTSAATVYAGFSNEAGGTLRRTESVKGVSGTPEIEIAAADLQLHDGNLAEYISAVGADGETVRLVCRPVSEGRYALRPYGTLQPGETYFVKALSSATSFVSVDGRSVGNADELSLVIYREAREVIEKKESRHVRNTDLAGYEENVYSYMDGELEKPVNRLIIRTDTPFAVGGLLTIGESDTPADGDYIGKIISAKTETMQFVIGGEIFSGVFAILEVITPNVDDVYGDLDIYGTGQAQLEGYISLSAEEVAQNVEDNEGMTRLREAVVQAVAQSQAVTEYAATLKTDAEKQIFMAALAGFSFEKPHVKVRISGTQLAFEIEIGGELQIRNFKLGISVVIENETTVDYRYTIRKSGKVTLNPLQWFYTNVQVDLSNDFSITLQAVVEFAEAELPDITRRTDISDEIRDIIDANKDGYNGLAEAISGHPLFDEEDSDLEYVDIFSIPLGQIPIPIVSVMLEFNVVGSLGARAGLYVEFSHHYVESTVLTNGTGEIAPNGKPVMLDSFRFRRTTTENEIEISVTLKGQVGFRCGLEAKLSLSVLRLNAAASVYVSFRFGPYIEISGLVSFRYAYDAVNRVSATQLFGSLYLEAGLFVNAKLGAHFLAYDVNTDLFDLKIPLYGIGERLIPLEFSEKVSAADDPYVLTRRSTIINMRSMMMEYLDIVTGEKVTDRATGNRYGSTYDYTLELIDAPDYQTENCGDYITITGGRTVHVSRRYELKTLRFAVKVTMLPRDGVFAGKIERVLYLEYRNPTGRDLSQCRNIFVNEYPTGYGPEFYEELAQLTYTEGDYIYPPFTSPDEAPVRPGFYLDPDDLWEKYNPYTDVVDTGWNGDFGKVVYGTTVQYYRLKWKRAFYKVNFHVPEYADADTVSGYRRIATADMIYVPGIRAFVIYPGDLSVPEFRVVAPDYTGKRLTGFVSDKGPTFGNSYYAVDPSATAFEGLDVRAGSYPVISVDTASEWYKNGFAGLSAGLDLYARYEDTGVYRETYVLQTASVRRTEVTYKPLDYKNTVIRPDIPQDLAVGTEFTEGDKTYVITGYMDINADNFKGIRYTSAEDLPDVTKDRIYYVLYERKGLATLPVYYVNIIANRQRIGRYGIRQGEAVNPDLLKINYDNTTVLATLIGCPSYRIPELVADGYSVTWDLSDLPSEMPARDIAVNLSASYTYKDLSADFVVTDENHVFEAGYTVTDNGDGTRRVTIGGRMWVYGTEDDSAFYAVPSLLDYFDAANGKYYAFCGWKNKNGEISSPGIRIAFTHNETYTPVFRGKTVEVTLRFVGYSDYGYEYYTRILSGDYLGRTLAEVMTAEGILPPVRTDAAGKYVYTFLDFGVDAAGYVIGSEKDLDGRLRTDLTFKARYTTEKKQHTLTFDAMDGHFEDGQSKAYVRGGFDERPDFSLIRPEDYTTDIGTFFFQFWTTVPYSEADRVDLIGTEIGTEDVTYYAYYRLDPATITLKFTGRAETEETDGTGRVYFDGDMEKTELTVTGTYGSVFYLNASMFAVDSRSKTFLPDYVKWTVNGEEHISEFYNDHYMAIIPFDADAEVEIVFLPATERIVNIAFVSDGECFEPDGITKIEGVFNGWMAGFRHVANYYQAYGTTMIAPAVYYSDDRYNVFDHWECDMPDGSTRTVRAGETVTFEDDCVFRGVYRHDTDAQVQLTFRSEQYGSKSTTGEGDLVYDLMTFPDGSVEILHTGKSGNLITFDKIPVCYGMIFLGWTTDGNDLITPEQLRQMTYSQRETYYAVYEKDPAALCTVELYAASGAFAGTAAEMRTVTVPYGTRASSLPQPSPYSTDLIFSHYEDENGRPVSVIESGMKLYACYGRPISSIEELMKVNLAPESNYVLTCDIIVGEKFFIYGKDGTFLTDWRALGADAEYGFSGTFNGNGYAIRFPAVSENISGFGLFSRISGTVFNLYCGASFVYSGTVGATALGAFCSEVTATGRIIDCAGTLGSEISVKAPGGMAAAGVIGVNYGEIDGFMAGAHAIISIETDAACSVGSFIGANYGRIANVTESTLGGAVAVSLPGSTDCSVGSFVGLNAGTIENSFAERAIHISFSQGDNRYLPGSVQAGAFAGRNDGAIRNCVVCNSDPEVSVSDVTLTESGMRAARYVDEEGNVRYHVDLFDPTAQGDVGLWVLQYIVYLGDNAKKSGTAAVREYTYAEFLEYNPAAARKLKALEDAVTLHAFAAGDGTLQNTGDAGHIGTGNIVELPAACHMDGVRWNYLKAMYDRCYAV